MDQKQLFEAIRFYSITDKEYIGILENTLEKINADEGLTAAFENGRSNLFTDCSEKLNRFWKLYRKKENIFGTSLPDFSTDLLLLSGYEYHKANMSRYSLDKNQIEIHLERMGDIFKTYTFRKNDIQPIKVVWASIYINGKMLEVGRLQYEYFNLDGKMPSNVVHIHIPATGKLSKELVDASLKEASVLLKKIYGVSTLEFRCATWLLSRQLKNCFEEGSNIAYFRSLFSVTDLSSCVDEVFAYLFHTDSNTPYADLPEDTSLQKKVKAYLLDGGDILKGDGLMIKDF